MTGSVFLVGLMGAGKSSVGRNLAKRLHKPFYDTDHEIERSTGVRIPLIFDIEGESGFRARESRVLAEMVCRKDIVLATGGGVVLSDDNRRLLIQNGTVVYLRAAPRDLWQRTCHDRNRPLLQTADPLGRLQQLFEERDPLYRQVAHVIMDTGSQSVGFLAHKLESRLMRLAAGRTAETGQREIS